jgi:hypothetical protein
MYIALIACVLVFANAFVDGGGYNQQPAIKPKTIPKDIPIPKSSEVDSQEDGDTDTDTELPKDEPKPSYGQQLPKPMPKFEPKQLPKDLPKGNNYGQKINDVPVPRPMPPKPSAYEQKPKPKPLPKDTPHEDRRPESSYGQDFKVKDTLKKNNIPRDELRPVNERRPSPIFTDEDSCPIGNTWISVMGCHECEMRKCAKACKSKSPSTHKCMKESAIFNLRIMFNDCLSTKAPTCHKLNEDQVLAFLLANYDSDMVDLSRREECLFSCANPGVMKCMDRCEPLAKKSDVDKEPIVLCYNELQDKISDWMRRFNDCLKQDGGLVTKETKPIFKKLPMDTPTDNGIDRDEVSVPKPNYA